VTYDVAIVGAGIVGLAHALAAVRQRLSVVVIDRDLQAVGASIRNFGFVTVTGQQAGDTWRRAMRSRDVWDEVAAAARIPILHSGLVVVARRPEAAAVLEAFAADAMGRECRLLEPAAARGHFPFLTGRFELALHSPHERRVESREAIPRLAAWLAEVHGVRFMRGTAVQSVGTGRLETAAGPVAARMIVVCPGDDLATLYPERFTHFGVQRSQLQMMRLMPRKPVTLGTALMTDLSLTRYPGYAGLAESAPLKGRLELEQPEHLAAGVHLIVVQSADGSLIVGDTHRYGVTMEPFSQAHFDALVLDEFRCVLPDVAAEVTERWIGTYAALADRPLLRDEPAADVRLVVVTSGTGASTAFAIGEETIHELMGGAHPAGARPAG